MQNTVALVCPSQLRHGLFTVGALDNLDHNPSSTTATDVFHGTGIRLFQFHSEIMLGSYKILGCHCPLKQRITSFQMSTLLFLLNAV